MPRTKKQVMSIGSGKTTVKLAEALLRRKELHDRLQVLSSINRDELFETKTQRRHVHEGIDDIIAEVPKLTAKEVMHEFNTASRMLRLVDAAIQQANWMTEVTLDYDVMRDKEI